MGFGIPGDDPEQSGGGAQLGKCVWSKCKLIRFTDQQLLVRHPSQILSLKCKIFLLGRVPALSPLYPVSQRSLLPGHLERKAQIPFLPKCSTFMEMCLGGLQRLNLLFHGNGKTLAILGFSSLVPAPILYRLAKKFPVHPVSAHQDSYCGHQH